MRADPQKFDRILPDLPIDQNEVGFDVAITTVVVRPDKRVISVPIRESFVASEQSQSLNEKRVDFLSVRAGKKPTKIFPEFYRPFNRPHGDRP